MITKRLLLALFVLTLMLPLTGCRHRCGGSSNAPPPPCCNPPAPPPGY